MKDINEVFLGPKERKQGWRGPREIVKTPGDSRTTIYSRMKEVIEHVNILCDAKVSEKPVVSGVRLICFYLV